MCTSHNKNSADSDPLIIPYKVINVMFTTLFGIITRSLPNNYSCTRCNIGLRHVELNYGNNATSAESFISDYDSSVIIAVNSRVSVKRVLLLP